MSQTTESPRLPYGALPMLVLAAMSDGADGAPTVTAWVEKNTGGLYKPGRGALYPRLYALEQRGLLIRRSLVRPVLYELSASGRQAASDSRKDVDRLLDSLRA